VAVVAAGELHDAGSTGEATRHADGRHGGLGAGRHEADQLDGRDAVGDGLCEQDLALGGSAVAGAVGRGALHRVDDGRVGVAEDDGAVALHEVDVATTLDVPHEGSVGASDEVRRAADGAERTHR
jgi:hypothetical protein